MWIPFFLKWILNSKYGVQKEKVRYVDLIQDFKHLKILKYLGTYFKCLKNWYF